VAPDAREDELVDALLGGDVRDVLALLDLSVVPYRPEVRDGEDRVRVGDGVPERPRLVQVAPDHRDATVGKFPRGVARRLASQSTDVERVLAREQVVDDGSALVARRSEHQYAGIALGHCRSSARPRHTYTSSNTGGIR